MTFTSSEAVIAAALIAALGSVAGAIIALINRGKLEVIHVLVNSNLAEIKRQLAVATAELARRDALAPAIEPPSAPPSLS